MEGHCTELQRGHCSTQSFGQKPELTNFSAPILRVDRAAQVPAYDCAHLEGFWFLRNPLPDPFPRHTKWRSLSRAIRSSIPVRSRFNQPCSPFWSLDRVL